MWDLLGHAASFLDTRLVVAQAERLSPLPTPSSSSQTSMTSVGLAMILFKSKRRPRAHGMASMPFSVIPFHIRTTAGLQTVWEASPAPPTARCLELPGLIGASPKSTSILSSPPPLSPTCPLPHASNLPPP